MTFTFGHGITAFDDDQLAKAADVIVDTQFGSVSMLQRKLGIGFAAAGGIITILEELRIVGAPRGAGNARDVLTKDRSAAVQTVRDYVRDQEDEENASSGL